MRTQGRTLIEKIAARHTVGWSSEDAPRAGDVLVLRPRSVMTHDNTSAVIPKFRAIAGPDGRLHDPGQLVFAMDHDVQNLTPENLGKYARIRAFAERHGVAYFPPGRGIAHQVMIEEGYVTPGALVVASDSHANIYGALACLGTPVVRTDAAALWATGEMWWIIPPQVRVVFEGRLPEHSSGKDVILALCARFARGEVLNCAIEFVGDGVDSLSIDSRMTIANMSTEWGALAAVFPFDSQLAAWLEGRAAHRTAADRPMVPDAWRGVESDHGARYVRELRFDLSGVSPGVTGPNSVSVTESARDVERRKIAVNKAYLMSCVNARQSDLEVAARVFGPHRRVAPGVEFYVAAASSEVERAARESGAWQRLMEAGAIALPAGCGACIGLGRGTLEAGEVGISATNRNFEGRMGSRDARCYLASPAVVAESAIRGHIAAPEGADGEAVPRASCVESPQERVLPENRSLLPGFPSCIEGRSLILPRNDVNTDSIYAGEATYRDDISDEEQGRLALRNYDPQFQSIVRRGDILVAGRNFGCGSSREQAATAIRACGLALVIAESVSQTYQRNAMNNAIIVIECPELLGFLVEQVRPCPETRTIVGPTVRVRFERGCVECGGKEFVFRPLNETAQALILAGGLEAMVASRLARRGQEVGVQ